MPTSPRVLINLHGNYTSDPGTRTKHELLFKSLAETASIIDIHNAELQNLQRGWAAIQSFHPNFSEWKIRYYLNADAFRLRSKQESEYIHRFTNKADVVLQIGTLYSSWQPVLPVILYLDYTAQLSIQKNQAGHAFRVPPHAERWLAMERRAYEQAAHICVRSHLVLSSLVEDYGISRDKISVVGGGANFSPLPSLPHRISRTEQPSQNLLFIGKDFFRKGGDLLIQAFEQLQHDFPMARLTLITDLPQNVNLPAGVVHQPPTWDREIIASAYANASIFVLPSRLETWGDVLLEAMSFALPCVGVQSDAMEDIVVDHLTGILVPPSDPDALAAALRNLLENPQVSQEYGLNGRERIEKTLNWPHVARELTEVLSRYC